MKGVYKITNPAGQVYIGQSKNITKRWWAHKNRTDQNTKKLKRSFDEHGVELHTFEVIHELPKDVEQATLYEYEKLYIELYNNCGAVMLNMTDGGRNFKFCEETKALQSEIKKGKPLEQRIGIEAAEKQKSRMSEQFGGKKQSAEWVAKRVATLTGRKLNDEQKENLGKHRIGVVPWNKGLKGVKSKQDVN